MAEENIVVTNEAAANATETTTTTNTTTTQPRPTFDEMLKGGYQAEFDRRVNKAIETARGKFSDPKVGELEAKLDGYIRREAILKAGVKSEFVDYVQYAVGNAMPEGKTFEAALTDFLNANQQYKAAAQPQGQAWSQPMQAAGVPEESGVEKAFKALNPNLKI